MFAYSTPPLLSPSFSSNHLTPQIPKRRRILQRRNRKAQLRLRRIRILERIPERVPLAEQTAPNLLPVPLRIRRAGHRVPRHRSDARPPRLGHPDGLAARHALGLRDGGVEVGGCEVDGVGFGVCEIHVSSVIMEGRRNLRERRDMEG